MFRRKGLVYFCQELCSTHPTIRTSVKYIRNEPSVSQRCDFSKSGSCCDKAGSFSILVEEVARHIHPAVEDIHPVAGDNRLAEAGGGHNLAAMAGRILTVAVVVRNPAAEADMPLVVARSPLAHHTVLAGEPRIVPAGARRIPDRLADGYLSHPWYHKRSR